MKRFSLTLLIILGVCLPVFSQVIEATVNVNLEQIRDEERVDKLSDFAEKIEHFINSNDWCDNPWNTVVYVNVEIVLADQTQGAEERYSASIIIDNSYDIQFFDKRWRFEYQSGEVLIYEEGIQDSFTSLIEFYLYMILGGEFDKWGTLSGTEYYNKARNIAEQAKFGMGRYTDGWDRRLELVNLLLSEIHQPFREMVDYYFYGLSFVKEENHKAREHIGTAIKMLDRILSNNPDNEYAQKFVEAHNTEIMEVYRRAKDKEPLRTLMVLDPKNENLYRDILRR